ncbi:MAG: sulfotransferase [Deltaproteobacteria bacterium]|nr:sulfotransferase [Deltaproteobacteria bacterium]
MTTINYDSCQDPSFFLIGMPRSGTSLLQAVINASGNLYLTSECHWMPYIKKASILVNTFASEISGIEKLRVEKLFKDNIRLLNRSIVNHAGRWGMQVIGSNNAGALDYLIDLYPGSRFIFLVRDPRDLLLSIIRTGMGAGVGAFPVQAHNSLLLINQIMKRFSDRFMLLRYEDLVSSPEKSIHKLCSFLECNYSERMLFPLTQRISGNENPALSEEGLKKGILLFNKSVINRWKSQLLDDDLLDLNCIFRSLKEFEYDVYEYSNLKLSVEAENAFSAHLNGACLKDGTTLVQSSESLIDIKSVGVVGLEITEGRDSIRRIHIQDLGELMPSKIYNNRYLLRIADGKPYDVIKRPFVYTWPLFKTFISLPSGSRVGIYSAGGSTRSFLEKIDLVEYRWDCIIDTYRRGSMNRIPIIGLEDAMKWDLDYIFVTSIHYYNEIRNELFNKGLNERDDFCLICFAHQEVG